MVQRLTGFCKIQSLRRGFEATFLRFRGEQYPHKICQCPEQQIEIYMQTSLEAPVSEENNTGTHVTES